jgi:hypothetical protein
MAGWRDFHLVSGSCRVLGITGSSSGPAAGEAWLVDRAAQEGIAGRADMCSLGGQLELVVAAVTGRYIHGLPADSADGT